MNPLFGIPVIVNDNVPAYRTVFKVRPASKLKKRRKAWRVVREKEACAFFFNPGAVGLIGHANREVFAINPKYAALLTNIGA